MILKREKLYLFSLCLLVGGSIGGKETAGLSEVLLGGTAGAVRIDIDDLPVDVERISSTGLLAT